MIEKMHEKTNGSIFKVVFSLISLSFVLGGIGGSLIGGNNFVAKVNGESIEPQMFNQAKQMQQNRLNEQLGEQFWTMLDNPEYVAQFNQSILNNLINDELLRQYAKNLKLGVSADQIKAEIVNSPMFQQNGKFSNDLYLQTLRNANLSAEGYAQMVGEAMIFAQLQQGIIDSEFSVPAQQTQLAKLLFQQRQIRVATHSLTKAIAEQSASDSELQTYYEANKTQFIQPEKLKVQYVEVSPQNVANTISITDQEISDYYQAQKSQFVTAGETRLAHIQVADEAQAKAIEQALQSGEDFAKLAQQKSLDKISGEQGGDLGWAKAGTYPAPFEDLAQSLSVGAVSQPVKVDGNYHLVKVLDRKEDVALPLEKVKDQIAANLRQEALLQEYFRITREMANTAFENSGSLEAVAKEANVTIKETAEFGMDNVPAELNQEAILKVLASDLRQSGQNSEAITVGEGSNTKTYFVRVSQYQAERPQTFEEAKAKVDVAVKADKAEKALLAKASQDLTALNEGKTAEVSFSPEQTLIYAKVQDPLLAQTVFSMPKPADKAVYQIARNQQGDVLIVALDKVIDGSLEQLKPVQTQLAQAEKAMLNNLLMQDLRKRASIEVNQEVFQQGQ